MGTSRLASEFLNTLLLLYNYRLLLSHACASHDTDLEHATYTNMLLLGYHREVVLLGVDVASLGGEGMHVCSGECVEPGTVQ